MLRTTVLLLLLATSVASAKSDFRIDITRSDLSKQRSLIDKALSGRDLSEITAEDRQTVVGGLARLTEELADAKSLSGVPAERQDGLLAVQADVNAALTRAMDDSRQVCINVSEIGSNRLKRKCETVAAKRRAYEQTQSELGASGLRR